MTALYWSCGTGTLTHRKGSKVLLWRLHLGHVSEERNCAWNTACTKLSLQRMWLARVSAATMSSGRPKEFCNRREFIRWEQRWSLTTVSNSGFTGLHTAGIQDLSVWGWGCSLVISYVRCFVIFKKFYCQGRKTKQQAGLYTSGAKTKHPTIEPTPHVCDRRFYRPTHRG